MNKNKNFRKSAIVIPALALMVLTAGAGTTGAVAWFTANRAATAEASTFTAVSPNQSLSITAANVKGTTASGSTVSAKVEETTSLLRDASFDAASAPKSGGALYRAVIADNAEKDSSTGNVTPTSYVAVTDYDTHTSLTNPAGEVYYAVSWTYTATFTNVNTNGSALFFDPNASSLSEDDPAAAINKGFRLAMINKDTGAYVVFSKADKADGNALLHVASTTTTGSYDATHFLLDSSTSTRYDDYAYNSSTVTSVAGYLGTFTTEKDKNSISLTCVAWYEGCDNNVVDSTVSAAKALSASLTFYARDLAA